MHDPDETREAEQPVPPHADQNNSTKLQGRILHSDDATVSPSLRAFADGLVAVAASEVDRMGDQTPEGAAASAGKFLSAFDVIPGYEIRSELGRGGMGVVYQARDTRLNREVALKMVLRADTDRVAVARFWVEAEAMAAVRHPHVVQVYELGEHDGRPYMVMELVSGCSLAARMKAIGALPPQTAALLVERVARGVAAAHELGIVHRDLKPGNVLLDNDDNPKVADFGLAKRNSNDLTATEALMGTPAYMAPEQAAGRAKFVGPQADVWALGIILYECVSGKRPFTGDSAAVLLANIQSMEPAALRTVANRVPRDLETIAAKCLAKEPEYRYPTAAEMADDLGRFVRGEPISARATGHAERLVRWVRRKPTAAVAVGGSTLAVLLAVVVFVVIGFWRDAEVARDEADRLREIADGGQREEARLRGIADVALVSEAAAKKEVAHERDKLAVFEYGRAMQIIHQRWRDNDLNGARSLLAQTRENLRGWEWDYVHRLCHSWLLALGKGPGDVTTAEFSPDGTRIVTLGGDGVGRVWDAKTGAELFNLKAPAKQPQPYASLVAKFSPDGERLLIGCENSARVCDARNGDEILPLKVGNERTQLRSATFSPDGSRILLICDGRIDVRDAKTGAEILVADQQKVTSVAAAFSPEGGRLVTCGLDRPIQIWDLQTRESILTIKVEPTSALFAAFSPDGSRIVTCGGVFGLRVAAQVWDAKTGNELFALKGHTASVKSASFSRDGKWIATVSTDWTVRVWNATTGAQYQSFWDHPGGAQAAAFSPDGSRIVTAGVGSGPVRVWANVGEGKALCTLKGHSDGVESVAFSSDGTRILTTSADGIARVWNAQNPAEVLTLGGLCYAAALSPDGTRAVGGSQVWDARDGKPLRTLKGHTKDITAIAFSRDGARIATSSADKTARVWDAETGSQVCVLNGHTDSVSSVAFNPDGTLVATGSWDNTVRVWAAKTGTAILTINAHPSDIPSVAFSPDGTRILTAGWEDRTARVWDAKTGAELLVLKGHTSHVSAAAFNRDGTRILTARRGDKGAGPSGGFLPTIGGGVQVWDAKTGEELFALGFAGDVSSATFSPDGSRILTGGVNGDPTARVWDASTGAELLTLKGHTSGIMSVHWSANGAKIITSGRDQTVRVWDATPLAPRVPSANDPHPNKK